MDSMDCHAALGNTAFIASLRWQVMAISTRGNKFFQDVKPWTILKKKEQDEAKRRDAK